MLEFRRIIKFHSSFCQFFTIFTLLSAHAPACTWIYTNLRPKLKAIKGVLCLWPPLLIPTVCYTMDEFTCWDFVRTQLHESNMVTALWWWQSGRWTGGGASSELCHLTSELVVKKAESKISNLVLTSLFLNSHANCDPWSERPSGKPLEPYLLQYQEKTVLNGIDFSWQAGFNWRACLKLSEKNMNGRNPVWVFREDSSHVKSRQIRILFRKVPCLKAVYFLYCYCDNTLMD